MAQVLIRDLDDETVKRLKDLARREGRSLEGEARLILTRAAGVGFKGAREIAREWHKRLTERSLPDSTEMIREDRRR
jgi:plasmid stability protein